MNLLGIDYGSKNIGLAWCQTELGVVLPFGELKTQNSKLKNKELLKIIRDEKIDKLVVGLPLGLDGKENENTKKVREFVNELKKAIKIPVEFVDERFSSREADRYEGGGASRDEKAAMVILESYMQSVS